MSAEELPSIDWTPLLKYPRSTVECRCGAVYLSHTKSVANAEQGLDQVSMLPCPSCGRQKNHQVRVSSGPHLDTISAQDIKGVTKL